MFRIIETGEELTGEQLKARKRIEREGRSIVVHFQGDPANWADGFLAKLGIERIGDDAQ